MPGHSSGAPQTSRHSKHHTSTSQGNHKPSRTIYRESMGLSDLRDLHGEHFRDHPRHSESKNGTSRTYPRNGTARGSETIGFIPGLADSAPASRPSCSSCPSMGWSGCKALLCGMLNSGCCGSRELSLPVNESSTDHPPKSGSEPSNGMALTNPTCGVSMEPSKPTKSARLPTSESFRYQDVRFRGEIVNYPVNPSKLTRPPAKGESQRLISNTSLWSNDYYDPCDTTDVDSLITKKLLELYTFHQIEELAKCTTDSSFIRKTNEISDLIYNIAQNYNLEEQEVECKLVHGVIRISTRKAKKKASHQRPNGRNDGTLPESGNETMTQTFMSSDFPEVKVSEQTPSDELVRKMTQYGSRTYSSSTSTAYSPYQHNTGTNSSKSSSADLKGYAEIQMSIC
ncbi:keratinocyte differentiation factor 1-like [Xiphophorus maculatus]|uniref:keratinocyte differentiation factor 1-like n=1 Tax=Xiphophorus maculatus TaxID=8083 RepID=UPI000C6E016F|nr:keratinocyte differentiation factor 1-like [Xiphophorus maculatus]